MLRINLLKTKVKKRQRKSVSISPKVLIAVGGIAGLLVVVFLGYKFLGPVISDLLAKKTAVKETVSFSGFTEANVVEEVVREVHEIKDVQERRGILNLKYDELSFAEKINYEIHFARSICKALSETVPSGIGFKTFKANKFRTVYGSGLCPVKEQISDFFTALKKDAGVEYLPQPNTNIVKRGNGFQFVFSGSVNLGLDLKAEFIDLGLSHLPSREDIPILLRKFTDTAKEQGVNTSISPRHLNTDAHESFLRFRYHYSGNSSYSQFVQFVNSLHKSRIPCAFESFTLTALSKEKIKIEADILFTTLK